MADLKVVAGTCGKGRGCYEVGVFLTPDGQERPVETLMTIEIHGDVAGARNWGGQVLDGIKSSLALASHIDLTGTSLLAASALAPLSADDPRTHILLEIAFADGAILVALADPKLAGLILNDREVIRRGRERFVHEATGAAKAGDTGLLISAGGAVQAAAGAATVSVGAALNFVRRRAGLEQG